MPRPPNCPPTAPAQAIETHEDTLADITLAGSGPDGSALTFTIIGSPVQGTISGSPPTVAYMPTSEYVGVDSSLFKVNDVTTDSAAATVIISVIPSRNPPIEEANGPYGANEGSTVASSAAGSSDGDGTISRNGRDLDDDGSIDLARAAPTYTWRDGFAGTAGLTVTDDDGSTGTDTAGVAVLNAAPAITGLTVPANPVAMAAAANIQAGSPNLTQDCRDGALNPIPRTLRPGP